MTPHTDIADETTNHHHPRCTAQEGLQASGRTDSLGPPAPVQAIVPIGENWKERVNRSINSFTEEENHTNRVSVCITDDLAFQIKGLSLLLWVVITE